MLVRSMRMNPWIMHLLTALLQLLRYSITWRFLNTELEWASPPLDSHALDSDRLFNLFYNQNSEVSTTVSRICCNGCAFCSQCRAQNVWDFRPWLHWYKTSTWSQDASSTIRYVHLEHLKLRISLGTADNHDDMCNFIWLFSPHL